MHNGGWAFVLAASGFVVFALWLAFSRYGKITLGKEGEEPEFRTVSWVAMMFSAGMGIGLMFYGVSEPLAHFVTPPPGTGAAGAPAAERMETAMATTLFHWTLHPWAIYAVVGLAIAYSCFRRGRRQTISAVFTPLIGEKNANGALRPGHRHPRDLRHALRLRRLAGPRCPADRQRRRGAGLDGSSVGTPVCWSTIIAVLTVAFVASAVSGVEKGIQWLSNINMVLAGLLVLFVFIVGPTIIDAQPAADVDRLAYIGELPQLAGRTEATARRGRRRLAVAAGRSSTGRGGSPGRPSSACSSPASAGAVRSVSSSAASSSCPASSA